ncbi:GIDE domain-containing protein [Candidatus Riflebacteria bacterium]
MKKVLEYYLEMYLEYFFDKGDVERYVDKFLEISGIILQREELKWVVAVIGFYFSVDYILEAHNSWSNRQMIGESQKTSIGEIKEAGFYKISGRIECDGSLKLPELPGDKLVYYELTRSREYESGKPGDEDYARYWETIDSEIEECTFFLRDDSGRIFIKPKGADMELATLLSQTAYGQLGAGNPIKDKADLISPSFTLAHSPNALQNRVEISGLKTGTEVIIIGYCRKKGDGDLHFSISKKKDEHLFISVKDEKELLSSLQANFYLKAALGILLFTFTFILVFYAVPAIQQSW